MLKVLALVVGCATILVGPPIVNYAVGDATCEVVYDRSFNGLWIVKTEVCRGSLGLVISEEEVGRHALFNEF